MYDVDFGVKLWVMCCVREWLLICGWWINVYKMFNQWDVDLCFVGEYVQYLECDVGLQVMHSCAPVVECDVGFMDEPDVGL